MRELSTSKHDREASIRLSIVVLMDVTGAFWETAIVFDCIVVKVDPISRSFSARVLSLFPAFFVHQPAPTTMPRKNKFISHELKLDVIERKKKGEGNSMIGRAVGLAESTVRTIWANREKIEKMKKCYGAAPLDKRSRAHDPAMVLMERYLAEHIRRKIEGGVAIDGRYIREKGKIFYATACKRTKTTNSNFRGSAGWLQKFLKRKGLKNLKLTGERASADEIAANQFPAILKKIIEEGGYTPEQIYNCDESGLQYKTMPKSTYIFKHMKQAKGRKTDKSRFTMLLTVNVSGTHKMRPVVVHKAAKPHCYRHLRDMNDSGVYWYKSSNGWMTSKIMADWLLDHAIPDAKRHCRDLGIPFKMLLIMDNAPCHPSHLQDLDPDCLVIFLPPNTTSLVQPLDQEVIATLKGIYQTHLYDYLHEKTDSNEEIVAMENDPDLDSNSENEENEPQQLPTELHEPEMTVTAFWRAFSVKNAVDFLLRSWGDISVATINHAWKALVPHLCKTNENDARVQRADQVAQVAAAAAQRVAGCGDVTVEEVQEVLRAGSQPTDDPVEEIDREDQQHEEKSMEPRPIPTPEIAPSDVAAILMQLDAFKECVKEREPCPMRTKEICFAMDTAVRYYHEQHRMHIQNRRQSLITRFLGGQGAPVAADRDDAQPQEPQPGPSTAPEPGPDDYDGFEKESMVVERLAILQKAIAEENTNEDPDTSSDDDDDDSGAGAGPV